VTVTTHLEDALEAVELLRANTDVSEVGLAGGYFGGMVAALTADRLTGPLPATALALWEPAVRGRDYMRSLMRLGLMTELIGTRRDAGDADPTETLELVGQVDVVGFPLRKEVFDEISQLNLTKDLRSFRGRALLAQVSKSSRPRPDMKQLAERLTELGGTVAFEVLQRPDAHKLRRPRFKGRADGTKVDMQQGLVTTLLDATLAWSQTLSRGAG
jgi:acetyl esterase/lipase